MAAGAVTSTADGVTLSLPAHCLVQGRMNPRTGIDGKPYAINFEMRLPTSWSGRFFHQVNGGNDGFITTDTTRAFGRKLGGSPTSNGLIDGFAVLTSDAAAAYAPDLDSPLWWPARAAIGDGLVLSWLMAGGLLLLGAVMAVFSPKFADTVVRVAATARSIRRGPRATAFRGGSRQQALRTKEFLLLRRDPWLLSQSLMQLLYLVPPALMLWRSFSESSAAIVLITPVIVMAAGQLAGGLAWLTISGEDAADLVATAPLPPSSVIRAKVEVVLITIGVIFAPLIAALAFASVTQAIVTALGVIVATMSASAIQLWFRVQAKRSQFRRRQTSSRLATFAEAFCSIGWAATAALAVTIPIAAVISGAMTAGILAATWKISPRRE
jgi:ABC-2 type transport system permease protein